MADNKVNSGLLEFSEDQKVFVALDAETSEVKKAVTIDGDGVETDIGGGGGGVTVEALSVTENGTYSEEGKAYNPVTVNVEAAASDFSTAEVVIIGETSSVTDFQLKNSYFLYIANNELVIAPSVEMGTYNVVLYKGSLTITPFVAPTVTGDATVVEEGKDVFVNITGNCTITVPEIA